MDTVANRNNNPGNLKDPSTGTFRRFGSLQEGYAALMNDLEVKKSGKSQTGLKPESTLADFAKVYAPSSDKNNPAQYAANIANHMKVRPDAPISSLDTGKWAEAIAHSEGYRGQSNQNIVPNNQVPEQPKEKIGLLQSFIRGVASPFLRAGANIATLADVGNPGEYEKDQSQGISYGNYLGNYRPIGASLDEKGNQLGFGKRVFDSIGTGIEAASTLLPVEGVGAKLLGKVGELGVKTLELISKGKLLKAAGSGALDAGVIGSTSGLGQGLQDPNATIGSVAGSTAIGGLVGGATGGVLGGTGGLLGKLSKTNRIGSIIDNNLKGLNELENGNVTVRKAIQDAKDKGVDVKDIVSNSDLLHGAVDDTGTIRTTQEGGAVSKLNDFIKPKEDVISKNLAREGKSLPISTVQDKLLSQIDNSGMKGGAKLRARNEVMQDIEGLKLDANPDGTIPLSVLHDAKVDKYSNLNYMNPESNKSGKAIASGFKQLVEDNTKSVDVKALNKELASHYATLNFLEKLDGKKVLGGKLGKYFAQTVGSIVGSHFGPLGSFVGAEVGGRLKTANMASKFSKATGKGLETSPAMQEAVARGQGLIRKVPVKSLPSEYTNKLPVIDAGETPLKSQGLLPQIQQGESNPKVIGSYLPKVTKAKNITYRGK